jgi:hypothetical protein
MRYFFLLLALLLAAQILSVATRPDSLVAAQAAPDTAAAIRRLFVAKRHVFRYVALGTLAAAITAIVVVTTAPATESRSGGGGYGFGLGNSGDNRGAVAFGIGLVSVPVLLVETLFCAGWSSKKERRALEAWQRHQLSTFYHRKLKPKYFQ